jgi:hypothetical protein
VRFESEAKDYDVRADKRFAETGRLLRRVSVYYRPLGGGEILVRRYVLDYTDYDLPHHYRLASISQYADEGETQALPATAFAYQEPQIGWAVDIEPGVPGWIVRSTVARPFLSAVDNGYGGTLTAGYQAWCLSGSPVVEDPGCASGSWWLRRQRVSSLSLSPGGGGAAVGTAYDYDGPGWEERDEGEVPVEAFIGYRWATELAGSDERRTTTEFYDTMYADYQGGPVVGHPKDLLKGKVLWVRTGKFTGASWHEYTIGL